MHQPSALFSVRTVECRTPNIFVVIDDSLFGWRQLIQNISMLLTSGWRQLIQNISMLLTNGPELYRLRFGRGFYLLTQAPAQPHRPAASTDVKKSNLPALPVPAA